jgi:peptidoglycan/LPS O-acetylase OafA/YrhL
VVRYAGFLVAAQGVAALVMAVVLLVRGLGGADQHIVSGYGTALWFLLIGAGVVTGGWALITGRRWGRGIGVPTNLLLLPVAWYVFSSHHEVYGVLVALFAVAVLGLLLSPPAVHWYATKG